jgi:transcriptional regulator
MPRDRSLDLLQGTLDLLVLKTLSWGPAHGYAIARWIERLTSDVLTVGEGSLYPALHRLEEREWIAAEWRLSEHNRRAKFYRLTARRNRVLGALRRRRDGRPPSGRAAELTWPPRGGAACFVPPPSTSAASSTTSWPFISRRSFKI